MGEPARTSNAQATSLGELSPEELSWQRAQEDLWKRAERIASRHPDLDVNGLYRTLKNLQRSPEERLRLGLLQGRLHRNARAAIH